MAQVSKESCLAPSSWLNIRPAQAGPTTESQFTSLKQSWSEVFILHATGIVDRWPSVYEGTVNLYITHSRLRSRYLPRFFYDEQQIKRSVLMINSCELRFVFLHWRCSQKVMLPRALCLWYLFFILLVGSKRSSVLEWSRSLRLYVQDFPTIIPTYINLKPIRAFAAIASLL